MLNKIFPEGIPPSPLERIKAEGKPVLLYGMGNGAEKMIAVCDKFNITVDGVFASDGFSSGKIFCGYKVLTVSDLNSVYPSGFTALVCFGCKASDMRMYIGKVKRAGGTVFMPHLPLFDGELMTAGYFQSRSSEIEKAYSLLSDDRSRRMFVGICRYFLTWDPEELFSCECNSYTYPDFFINHDVRTAIDGGAYRGDTVLSISNAFPKVNKIIAFEPDAANFAKLKTVRVDGVEIECIEKGLYKKDAVLSFAALKNRGSHFAEGGIDVPVTSIDIATGEKIDLIKLDVEGCEAEAIDGSINTLLRYHPALYISLYHKTDDFFELILKINGISDKYEFSLLREDVCPAWDIILLARKRPE